MGTKFKPGALLCVSVGALLGASASFMAPIMSASGPPASPLLSLSLFSLEPSAIPIASDSTAWADDIRAILKGAIAPEIQTVILRPGDTLGDVLIKTGVDPTTAFGVVGAMHAVYNPKRLQAGQELALAYDPLETDADGAALTRLDFELDAAHSVSVVRQEDGTFSAKEIFAETRHEFVRAEGVIATSLFEAARAQGLPMDVLAAMVKMFSYDVDFQRDIQKGDHFAVLYERLVTRDGRPVRNLTIHSAAMELRGSPLKYYAFPQSDGTYDYYNDKGEGVRKALLRTPVNGAVLTSGFGLRKHPILGYSLMHRGVDFGAPTGTPIMAAGDGFIEKRASSGTYGNYIRIRHRSDYATAYAHMSRFARGIAVGKRVRQGQIIGYVGRTGRATGPHLHFEILRKMAQVNPVKIKFPASQKLVGVTLTKFRRAQIRTNQIFASIGTTGSIAMAVVRNESAANN